MEFVKKDQIDRVSGLKIDDMVEITEQIAKKWTTSRTECNDKIAKLNLDIGFLQAQLDKWEIILTELDK